MFLPKDLEILLKPYLETPTISCKIKHYDPGSVDFSHIEKINYYPGIIIDITINHYLYDFSTQIYTDFMDLYEYLTSQKKSFGKPRGPEQGWIYFYKDAKEGHIAGKIDFKISNSTIQLLDTNLKGILLNENNWVWSNDIRSQPNLGRDLIKKLINLIPINEKK